MTEAEIKRYMQQPRCIEYPDKIPDDYGCGYHDDKYFTDPKKDEPRIVTLEITSFMGFSAGAVHYYGELRAEGADVHPIGRPHTITTAYELTNKDPRYNSYYIFQVCRPITEEEIKADEDRWFAYEPGDPTSGFEDKEELIELAKEFFKYRFVGNWEFVIRDTTE